MSIGESLLDRISKEQIALSRAERQVASIVLKDPKLIPKENISSLAKRAKVSEPSVCRFCKSFGFSGFVAFKTALLVSLSQDLGVKVKKIEASTTLQDLSLQVIEGSISVLQNLKHNLNLEVLNRAISLICGARRIVILSTALCEPYAKDLQIRLLRQGIVTEVYSAREQILIALSALSIADLVMVIDLKGSAQSLLEALELASSDKIASLSIAPSDSEIASYSSLNLNLIVQEDFFADDLLLSLSALQALNTLIVAGVKLNLRERLDPLKEKIALNQKKAYDNKL